MAVCALHFYCPIIIKGHIQTCLNKSWKLDSVGFDVKWPLNSYFEKMMKIYNLGV